MKIESRCTAVIFCTGLFLLFGCAHFDSASVAPNELSNSEKRANWRLLFDGKTLSGWRRFGKQEPPRPGWFVEDGCLKLKPHSGAGDIITEEKFGDFEFQWDWRIPPKANNGIKYLVTEGRPSAPGVEYQMADDATMTNPKHQTATLYDILPILGDKPILVPGEWNRSRLVVRGPKVEHWLNGKKVLQYELDSEALQQAIAQSKFKNVSDFHKKIKGHILLTDHQDECSFRTIKIREWPSSSSVAEK